MNSQRQSVIKEKIKAYLRNKFQPYTPETDNMPSHYRLLGKDRMALFSFIHAMGPKFWVPIYEQIAIELAREQFKVARTQVKPFSKISSEAQRHIETIMDELRAANREINKPTEVGELRSVCRVGNLVDASLNQVDIWLENREDELFLINLKTEKPDENSIETSKRNLLGWSAAELARDPNVAIHTLVGIPYNF